MGQAEVCYGPEADIAPLPCPRPAHRAPRAGRGQGAGTRLALMDTPDFAAPSLAGFIAPGDRIVAG